MAQHRVITEGFDLYTGWAASNGTGAASRWSTSSANPTLITGRFGGQAIGGGSGDISRPIPSSSMVSMGAAVRVGSGTSVGLIFQMHSTSGEQLSLRKTSTGALTINRGSTVLATSPIDMLPSGQWAYIEFAASISNTTGLARVAINGVQIPELSIDNVDTQNQSTSSVDIIRLQVGNPSADYDDLYVEIDGTSHIGEGRIWTGTVVSDISSDFTPLTGASNFAMVDEVPVSATDYNYSDILGARDVFHVADLNYSPAEIYGVQVTMNASKDEAGIRAMKSVLISGAAEELGSQFVLALSANNWKDDFWPVNPDTGLAWTISDVNAINIGYEISL